VRAGREVLFDIDDKSALIVGDPQGILGQRLRHCPIELLKSLITL